MFHTTVTLRFTLSLIHFPVFLSSMGNEAFAMPPLNTSFTIYWAGGQVTLSLVYLQLGG